MPTAVATKKSCAAAIAAAVSTLEAARERHGAEFFLVLAKPVSKGHDAAADNDNAYEVIVRASVNLRDLEHGQDFEWRVPKVIRSSKQHTIQVPQLGLRFEQLGDSQLCTVMKEVLLAGISNRKKRFPFGTATSEQVAAEVQWFPAAIAWRSPDHWQRTEMLQLLASLPEHLSQTQLKQLSGKVMSRLKSRCNAHDFQQLSTAFEKLQQGGSTPEPLTGPATAVDIDLDSGLVAFRALLAV